MTYIAARLLLPDRCMLFNGLPKPIDVTIIIIDFGRRWIQATGIGYSTLSSKEQAVINVRTCARLENIVKWSQKVY